MASQSDLDKTIGDLLAAITAVKTAVDTLKTKIDTEVAAVNDAFSRFLAKLAAGNPPPTTVDLQPEIDQIKGGLSTLSATTTALSTASASLDSAIAQANVEGN